MYLRHWRQGRPNWLLLALAAFLVVGSTAAADAQNPPGISKAAAGETNQDLPVGFTGEGYPFRGDPNASLTLVEFSDFLCPFCVRYFSQTLPTLLEKYGRTGQVKFVVRDFPIASLHPTAPRGAAAARCAAEQGAAPFWRMYDALFRAQPQWSRLPDPTAFLAKTAREAGADMTAYDACVASGRQDAPVQQSVAAAQALGFNGTPTFQLVLRSTGKTYTLVGAQPVDVFTRWIDALLAGKEPPKEEQAEAAPPPKFEVPFWAKPEGLAPDPTRPGFTVAGDRYKGSPDAKFVMVEFIDFECSACQRHALTTQPELDKQFVDTGEIRWIVKHFPLGIHPHAPVAAAAAQCAGEQGKFWPMYHSLFSGMEQWSGTDELDVALSGVAADLGLDRARFTACLTSRQPLQRVLRDLYDGQAVGVRNVPAFVLFQGETPFVLVGARSTEQFASLLRRQVDRAKSLTPPTADGARAVGR
jgi:protein-disulfide isomerase